MRIGRVAIAALAAAVAAVIGNFIIATIFKLISDIPAEFEPLNFGRFALFTIVGVIGAAIVYWILGKLGGDPVKRFYIIALIVLVLSFIPDFGLLSSDFMPGATMAGVMALMLMHVVTAVACIILFPRLAPPA